MLADVPARCVLNSLLCIPCHTAREAFGLKIYKKILTFRMSRCIIYRTLLRRIVTILTVMIMLLEYA